MAKKEDEGRWMLGFGAAKKGGDIIRSRKDRMDKRLKGISKEMGWDKRKKKK